jgi:hypothetical protein
MKKEAFIFVERLVTIAGLLLLALPIYAQETEVDGQETWIRIHQNRLSHHWIIPVHGDSLDRFDVSSDGRTLATYLRDGFVIPFATSTTDSLDFAAPLSEEQEEKDHYRVFQMYVFTQDGLPIASKTDYVPCYIALNGDGSYADRLLPGKIRGRGNSTWEWYDKKPYRIKLDKKHKLLGLAKAKSWVLLANYRDVTDLMNTFVFELGRWMGLPYTNHTRYVELFVNDEYVGLYQLTEQIQQGESRVAVSDERGILLSLDTDDGPELSPGESNNFWTKVFGMPAAVKYPEDEQLTAARRDSIRNVFATLEEAINHQDYATASTLMDMESFVRYLIIQQLIYNVELSSPRSIYIHKDGDGPWTMGPLWDFDAGYDFDWSNMYSGHTFFSDYRETLLGSNPVNRNGTYKCSKFFTQLFGCKEFVKLYKDTWNQYAGSLMEHTWGEMERYLDAMRQGAMQREMQQWPIAGKTFEAEVAKMKAWLNNRVAYVGQLINNIPEPGDVTPITEERLCGTVDVNTTMEWSNGYHQTNKVVVDRAKVLSLLGVESAAFKEALVTIVPLKTDGTVGSNGTNGTFGGWFNAQGNPGAYAQGHVYIEVFDDLFNWNCGLYMENCSDDTHTVTMQYQYPVGSCLCKVNVRVKFTINNAGGGHWWW